MAMSSNLPVAPDDDRRGVAPALPLFPERLAYPSARGLDEEPAPDYRRYLAAILRYKWLFVLGGVVGLGLGYGMKKVRKPQYQAQATIWLQASGQQQGPQTSGPIQQAQLFGYTSWTELLRSYVVLDEVVRRMHLFLQPQSPGDSTALASLRLGQRFRPGIYRLTVDPTGRQFSLVTVRGGVEIQHGTVGDSIGQSLGFAWAPDATVLRPGRSITFTVSTPRDAAVYLSNQLQASLAPQGNFLRLTLTGTSPSFTAATLNAVAQQFVQVAAQLKTEKLDELTRILGQQLRSAEEDLRHKEGLLEGFRVATITLPSDRASPVAPGLTQTRDPVFQNFFSMKVEQEGLRRDREAVESVLASSSDTANLVVSLEAIPAVRNASELMGTLTDLTQKQAELRALRNRYTEEYLPVQRLTADINVLKRQTVPAMARSLVEGLKQRELEMDSRVASASRDLRQIPARAIEEARLSRDVSIAENLYTTLQARYEEARLTEVSSIPDVRILDAAVTPEWPVRSVTRIMQLGGLAGGLGLALILALVLDRFDRRIRYPEQVTRDMGLTILGVVPRVKGGKGIAGEEAVQVLEALRTVRLNLVHAYGSAGPLVVTITSPGPGDGKSFIASNLANAFADMGHRTLLIDGDTRRGMLHRVLNLQRKPGLLDHLSGRATREEIVQRAANSSVDFIGSGTRKSGGPELLASGTMSQLLTGLRSSYSVIILDSPPLGAGVDALMLGTLAGSIMLVLRTGVTDRELAQVKLDHLYRLPIRLLGAVLNDVRADAAYRYYYSSYYLPGYESKDEEGEPAAAQVQQLGTGGGQDAAAGESL
jgi:capsular exopolysaccharide synthesis family protein